MPGKRMVCFDDRAWESYTVAHLTAHAKYLTVAEEGDDATGKRIAYALLSRNKGQSVKAPGGFPLGRVPEYSENSWEAFRRFLTPAPVAGTAATTR
eukprot:1320392-Pleurochrysis_carterae.AAC.1